MAYQFLRSALNSEVDGGTLLQANSPNEAWRNLESWHKPKSISATQALHDCFQSYSMKIMVASFHSCGTSSVIHTAPMMSWNASKISWDCRKAQP